MSEEINDCGLYVPLEGDELLQRIRENNASVVFPCKTTAFLLGLVDDLRAQLVADRDALKEKFTQMEIDRDNLFKCEQSFAQKYDQALIAQQKAETDRDTAMALLRKAFETGYEVGGSWDDVLETEWLKFERSVNAPEPQE